jgi:type IV pilus assembly protein PilA
MSAFSWKFVRPLPKAHWSLPVFLVASGMLLTLAQPCKRGPYHLEAASLTAFICVVAWANHLANAPIRNVRAAAVVVGHSTWDLVLLVFLMIVASIPFAIFLPAYQCYTDRARASEVLLATSGLRTKVEARTAQLGTTVGSGVGFTFVASGRARAGVVSPDGAIVAIGIDPPVVFLLSPRYADSKVEWKCQGFPTEVVPATCRGE